MKWDKPRNQIIVTPKTSSDLYRYLVELNELLAVWHSYTTDDQGIIHLLYIPKEQAWPYESNWGFDFKLQTQSVLIIKMNENQKKCFESLSLCRHIGVNFGEICMRCGSHFYALQHLLTYCGPVDLTVASTISPHTQRGDFVRKIQPRSIVLEQLRTNDQNLKM